MTGGGGSVAETTGNQGQMRSVLSSGLDALDLNQTVTFTLYNRLVLPADGFVFWAKTATSFEAQGSLHHTTVNRQDPDEAFSVNRMVFTSKQAVDDLNAIQPDSLYLATTNGQRYAFSSRSMWYRQAALYHYSGDAVYPALASQLLDSADDLDPSDVVVSNSLPVWLTLNSLFPVYPSFLVPDNIAPPYASVHIGGDDTHPMQAGPTFDATGSRYQLARDHVRVTTYGVRNDTIMDWLDTVSAYTFAHPDVLGIMNSPVPRDDKRGQTEISALAQKKTIVFEASYYQTRMRDIARQLIETALLESFLVPGLN